MVHEVFKLLLRLSRILANKKQIGNPYKTSPKLIDGPNLQDSNFISKTQNMICSGLYGGAIINSQNEILGKYLSFPWGKQLHYSISSPYLGRKKKTINKGIFLITPEGKKNYYHWMTDLLPRLLLVIKFFPDEIKDSKIILHYPANPYEDDTLRLLNIDNDQVIRLKSFEWVFVETLIISDYINNENGFPYWKKNLLDKFALNFTINQTKDISFKIIYLLRGQQLKRNLIGEENLVTELKKLGVEIYDSSKMNLQDQINLLSHSKLVIALHGAALTNIIFCKPRTHVIEIRSINSPPEFYSDISKIFDLNFHKISIPTIKGSINNHKLNKQNLIMNTEGINQIIKKINEIRNHITN